MSLRELVVLGTASQVPTRHRNHNGYFLHWDGCGLLFDPGEGMQRQMIHYGVTASQITHVLITHFHGDHCLGLPSVIQRISLDEVPHEVDVVFPGSGRRYYERLRRASIFRDRSRLRPVEVREPGIVSGNDVLSIHTLRLDHGPDTWGYRIQEPDHWTLDPARLAARGLDGPIVGRIKREGHARLPDGSEVRVEDVGRLRRGQSFAFVMDTRVCEHAVELARGVDLLVCESTYLHGERAEAHKHGHLTARQAAEIAVRAGARKLVLGHFSQRYQETEPFLAEASQVHPDVVAVRDGDRIPVPARAT